ncbi:hypothetical protein ACFQAV_09215 [Companilactobacillus huachuanensis]|uniref:Uncharacterized protein n=1 Tax=Companilactobacillus huachuanensis TaxID=2559914 RepID=A0ABW1RND2_9LACO|nr:hypothetical protein [Companilactobacillus huachuanensis]
MRKKLILLSLLVFVLPLFAFTWPFQHQTDLKTKTVHKSTTSVIRHSNKIWQKSIKDADIIDMDGQADSRGYIAYSMSQLKEVNKLVVKGTIIKLESMNNPNNMALTKATIKIDKILHGKKSLNGKTITVAFNGGVTTFDKWYAGLPSPKDEDHKVFIKYDEFPIPEIGSQIITGLLPANASEPSDYMRAIKNNKFDFKKTYVLGMPEFNLWVKKPNEKEFYLNNPLAAKKLVVNPTFDKGISGMTQEFNQK